MAMPHVKAKISDTPKRNLSLISSSPFKDASMRFVVSFFRKKLGGQYSVGQQAVKGFGQYA